MSNQPNSNVAQLPNAEKPDEYHKEFVKSLMPDNLKPAEQRVWHKTGFEMSKAGRLKKLYVDALYEYCRLVVRMAETRKYLEANGWTYDSTGRNGDQTKTRPEVPQLNDDWRKWKLLVTDLGLSPNAESRLSKAKNNVTENAFNKF